MEDYSPEDIKDLLAKYSQKPGEKPQHWLVRLMEERGDTVLIDSVDASKFLGLATDPFSLAADDSGCKPHLSCLNS